MGDRPLADTIVAEQVALERASPSEIPATETSKRYATLSGLGQGGMGEVWLLRDGVIGRDVAMKSIRNELRDDGLTRARFLREARIQGQLEHPSIVPVYDLGIGPNKQPFFTMQRVRGRTLDALLPLPMRNALMLMSRVCLAIDFAHTHGVIHRDIKPANIMVGDWGEVYVLDWGVAKIAGSDDVKLESTVSLVGEDLDATTAGALLGTPGYMSPEQAQSKTLDARSDVYALGSMLFEVLTGHPLHEGTNVASVLRSTIGGADARISKRHPDLDIPLELEEICIRATRTNPDERYTTAREMHEAIERFLEGDRDLELRRKRSVEHARAAKKLAKRSSRTRERSEAMREVGRALALDPDNRGAMRTMIRLLTDPPKTLPREVEDEIVRERDRRTVTARKFGGIAFLSTLFPAIFILQSGVRSWLWFLLTFAGGVIASVVSFQGFIRDYRIRQALIVTGAIVGLVASTRFAGPFVAVPLMSMGLAIGFAVLPRPVDVRFAIALGWVPIVAPLVLEWMGVFPSSSTFTEDRWIIHPELASFSSASTIAYLLIITLGPIAAVCIYVVRLRQRAEVADRQLRLMAWQLRQIVPQKKSRA